jgi:iron transport multicopper oxidase
MTLNTLFLLRVAGFNLDWYHQEHGPLLDHFLSIYNPTGAEPVPQSPLINESTNQTFVFSPKKTYRLRFIAMSALSRFNVWIDNHNMTVIEVDGINVEPFETSVLNVAAAQRYSVLVTADKPPDFNYMMHVEFDTLMFDNVPDDTVLELTALLEYKRDNPVFASEAKKPDPSAFVDTNLVPLIPERVAPASVSHLLNVYIGLFEDGINYSVFNEIPFELPKTPSLFTALSMGNDSLKPEIYGKRTNVIVLNHMDMIELVIENTDPGHHPCN